MISVIVGVPASVEILVDKDLTELKVDETVTVECITISEGNPPVSVNLYHEQKGEESQHLGDGSMIEYSPTLSDTGSAFTCSWAQIGPNGEFLYEGKVHSSILDVIMAPVLLNDWRTEFEEELIFEEAMELKVQFKAKPWPQEGDIVWMITDDEGNEFPIEHSMGQGHFNITNQGHFLIDDVKDFGDEEFQLESVLHVLDLKEDVTILVNISNSVGSVNKSFSILMPETTTTTTTSTTTTTTTTTELNTTADGIMFADHLVENEVVESSINSATIVAIVIGVLFGVALITCGFVCFNTKGSSSTVQSNDKNKSNRGSGYFPVDNGFGGSKSQRGSAYFTPEKHVKPFASEPVVMRQNSGRRVRNTEMTTFGKDKVQGKEKSPRDSDIEPSVKKYLDSVHYDSSPVVVSSSTQPLPVVATLEVAMKVHKDLSL